MNKLKLYISTGKFKRTILNVPTNCRPVKDIVKQSAFSFIGSEFIRNKNVLDLYSGSGQLGFEALSQKAKSVTFVDNDYNSRESIKKTIQKLNLMDNTVVIHKDALKVIGEIDQKFDIIFADPPYNYKHKHLLKTVNYVLNNNGIFIFFHSSKIEKTNLFVEGLSKIQTRIFGLSAYSVYKI